MGRWLSRDPSGESVTLNTYAFVNNASPNKVDVLGLYQRSPTTGRFGVDQTYNGRRVIGPGTGLNGLTIGTLDVEDPAVDVTVSVEDCKCVLTRVNATARITVFVPLNGDQIFNRIGVPITATGKESENIQRHESAHVFADQRIFDTLTPKLESSCTGRYLSANHWTQEGCHARWVQIVRNNLGQILRFADDWSDVWHTDLGFLNAGNPDYVITTAKYLAYVRVLEKALARGRFDFCDSLPKQ